MCAIFAQISAFVLWPFLSNQKILWITPVAAVLISCRWWENYISDCSSIRFIRALNELKENLTESRYMMYLLIAPWKMLITLLLGVGMSGIDFIEFFDKFMSGWGSHTIEIHEVSHKTKIHIFNLFKMTPPYRLIN